MIQLPNQFLNDKEECRFYKRLLKYSQDAIIDLLPDSIKEMFPYGKKSYLKYDKSEDRILWFDSLVDAILELAEPYGDYMGVRRVYCPCVKKV